MFVLCVLCLMTSLVNGCNEPLDLVFLVDGSSSVSPSDFIQEKAFVSSQTMEYSVSPDQVRIAVLLYSDVVWESIDFKESADDVLFVNRVSSLTQTLGDIFIDKALKGARDLFKSDGRPGTRRVVVLITAGRSNRLWEAFKEARKLRQIHTSLYAIAVGDGVSGNELMGLTSDRNNVLLVDIFNSLFSLTSKLHELICPGYKQGHQPVRSQEYINVFKPQTELSIINPNDNKGLSPFLPQRINLISKKNRNPSIAITTKSNKNDAKSITTERDKTKSSKTRRKGGYANSEMKRYNIKNNPKTKDKKGISQGNIRKYMQNRNTGLTLNYKVIPQIHRSLTKSENNGDSSLGRKIPEFKVLFEPPKIVSDVSKKTQTSDLISSYNPPKTLRNDRNPVKSSSNKGSSMWTAFLENAESIPLFTVPGIIPNTGRQNVPVVKMESKLPITNKTLTNKRTEPVTTTFKDEPIKSKLDQILFGNVGTKDKIKDLPISDIQVATEHTSFGHKSNKAILGQAFEKNVVDKTKLTLFSVNGFSDKSVQDDIKRTDKSENLANKLSNIQRNYPKRVSFLPSVSTIVTTFKTSPILPTRDVNTSTSTTTAPTYVTLANPIKSSNVALTEPNLPTTKVPSITVTPVITFKETATKSFPASAAAKISSKQIASKTTSKQTTVNLSSKTTPAKTNSILTFVKTASKTTADKTPSKTAAATFSTSRFAKSDVKSRVHSGNKGWNIEQKQKKPFTRKKFNSRKGARFIMEHKPPSTSNKYGKTEQSRGLRKQISFLLDFLMLEHDRLLRKKKNRKTKRKKKIKTIKTDITTTAKPVVWKDIDKLEKERKYRKNNEQNHFGNKRVSASWNYRRPTRFLPGNKIRRKLKLKKQTDDEEKTIIPEDYECSLLPHDTDASLYIEKTDNRTVVRPCPEGTAFELKSCACTIMTIVSGYGDCSSEIMLDFNTDKRDKSGKNVYVGSSLVDLSNGSAVFGGNSELTIWRFTGSDFGQKLFIKIRFKAVKSPNVRQYIISNCHTDIPISYSIEIDRFEEIVIFSLDTQPREIKEVRIPFKLDHWTTVSLIYDGLRLIGIVDGKSNSIPLAGDIETRSSPLRIGGCGDKTRGFTGLIDEVTLSFCIPKMKGRRLYN